MKIGWSNGRAGAGRGMWPAMLIVIGVILVPTAWVLWFMNEAVRNERFAVRQKLVEVYRGELLEKQRHNDEMLEACIGRLEEAALLPGGEAFERVVSQNKMLESAVVFNGRGEVEYPVMEVVQGDRGMAPEEWGAGRELEEAGDIAGAAVSYGKAAEGTGGVDWKAEALRAEGRCLIGSGDRAGGLKVLGTELARKEFGAARDEAGQLIVPNAELLALRMMCEGNRAEEKELREQVKGDLRQRLVRHDGAAMPAGQRLFLLREFAGLAGDQGDVGRWIRAEEMAMAYVEAGLGQPGGSMGGAGVGGRGEGRSTKLENVWTLSGPGKRVVGLWGGLGMGRAHGNGGDSEYAVEYVGTAHGEEDPLVVMAALRYLPEVNEAVYLTGPVFGQAARRKEAVYLWTGGVGIAAIALLGAGMGMFLRRQARLTRLKNDLIATVSHELKTPLSSMRVLVDTLLEGRCRSGQQEKEYLGLISRENMRLSRLIDNFLTFSRMERNKKTFEFRLVDVGEIVRGAMEALGERSGAVRVEMAEGLPAVRADVDAMITVVVNLLDNAWKYSGEPREIRVRTFAEGGEVCLAVEDHGMGIPRRQQRKIFARFYQIDQTLSRKAGGCGLGLSIVRFIVDAHGGAIGVESQVGKGSTFTVRLPRALRAVEEQAANHGG